MPKVKEEYYQDKRVQILDAAYRVFMRKPVYAVTMKDIINEIGWSQGAIYRYFKNIHEILYELVNLRTAGLDIKQELDAILAQPGFPEQVIAEVFNLITRTGLKNIQGFGKILFEYTALMANQPEYCESLIREVRVSGEMQYLKQKTIECIQAQISNGYFKPRMPFEDIFTFVGTSIDGIERDLILIQCYRLGDYSATMPTEIDPQKLMEALCRSFIYLLGGDPGKIYKMPYDENEQ